MRTSEIELPRYRDWAPSQFDTRGLGCKDRQDWLVVECIGQNRDSDALARSNFRVVLKDLGGESDDVEVHRFGHWACGWFEIVIVRPDSAAHAKAQEWVCALSDYPIASNEDFSELEQEDANEVWANCYNPHERLEYIRDHRSEFEFHDFADLIGCVRGKYFAGYAGELLNR